MQGRTITKALTFETRQHSLFGVEFGEGIPRTALVLGGGALTVWAGTLWLLFGPPNRLSVMAYFTMPLVVVFFAFQEDPQRPRRKRVAAWVLRLRYAIRGHRPLVGRELSRNSDDLLPAGYRLGWTQAASKIRGKGEEGVWDTNRSHDDFSFGPMRPYRVRLTAHITPGSPTREETHNG